MAFQKVFTTICSLRNRDVVRGFRNVNYFMGPVVEKLQSTQTPTHGACLKGVLGRVRGRCHVKMARIIV